MLFIQVDTNIILRLCLLLNRVNKQKNGNLLFLSYSEKVSQMTFILTIRSVYDFLKLNPEVCLLKIV